MLKSSFLPFWEVQYSVADASKIRQAAQMTTEPPNNADTQPPPGKPAGKAWRTALLLAASAAFGGLAVAIWDRKILADMRNRMPEPPQRSAGREDDIY
jgi:hypothetical protein